MSYTYQYPRPAVTVDAVVFNQEKEKLYLLLIRRKHDPFAGKWALPGGFMDMDEAPQAAVERELKKETGIEVKKFVQVGAFGDPDRDPRHRTISIVYYTVLHGALPDVQGQDDAEEAKWFPVEALPATLAFDHEDIIHCSKKKLKIELRLAGTNSNDNFGLEAIEIEKILVQLQKG